MRAARSSLFLVLAAAPAFAQAAPSDWLASEPAAVFRQRVVDLAVLYDEASGIDPEGFRVQARRTGARDAKGCLAIEVVTLRGSEEVRREVVGACGKAAGS